MLVTRPATAAAAQARTAVDAASADVVLRLVTVTGVPPAVTAANAFRVRERVVNLPQRPTENTARLDRGGEMGFAHDQMEAGCTALRVLPHRA